MPTPASVRVWEGKARDCSLNLAFSQSGQCLSWSVLTQTLNKSLARCEILYKNTGCSYKQAFALALGNRMIKLTARQEQILALIRDAIDTTGFPPTRAEIASELGFRSANAAEEHLQALARKGAIEISPGTSRGIRLLDRPADGIARPRRFGAAQLALPHPELMQFALPLVGRVAAGSPILAEEHISATYQVDPALFTARPDYLLKVRGMSMRDAGIMDGDLLAVKKADSARDGQIVVARLDDDVTVKRFRRNGGVIELLPENPDFDTIRVEPGKHEFALEGLAVGLLRAWG